jgi:hypothetical protein
LPKEAKGEGNANCRGDVPFIIADKLVVKGGCIVDDFGDVDGAAVTAGFALLGWEGVSARVGWLSNTVSDARDCTEFARTSCSVDPGVTLPDSRSLDQAQSLAS